MIFQNQKHIRTFHLVLGRIFAPFFMVASLTAIPLFFRETGLYSDDVTKTLVFTHTWEGAVKYAGILMALALIFMSCTGVVMTLRKRNFKFLTDMMTIRSNLGDVNETSSSEDV